MAEWGMSRLRDLGKVVGGGTPSRERLEYWNGSIPWLTPRELTGNNEKYVSETHDCISQLGLVVSGARLLPEGSLLVTSRASIGSCALAGRPMATNQGFKNLVPSEDVDPSYLFYLGRILSREMTRRASGTTFLEISGREFGRITIMLPPLGEQRQIAEILDTIDEAIQATKRIIAKHTAIRTGLATHLLLSQVRTSRSVPLSDLAEINPRTPSPTLHATVSFLPMADVSESGFIKNIHLKKASSGYTPFVAGDVLVAKITPCFENGKGAHAQAIPTRCGQGSTEFHVLRARSDAHSRYLYHVTRTGEFRRRGEGLMSGSAGQQRVPSEFFNLYTIMKPPMEEQRRIAEILDAADESIRVHERERDKLKQLRSGLAADLLSGRVRTVAS